VATARETPAVDKSCGVGTMTNFAARTGRELAGAAPDDQWTNPVG
jgi:hypothetical protein